MAVAYNTARELLGELGIIWERTEPTSQLKTAIPGLLVKAVHSQIANTRTTELTIFGMDQVTYVWEGAQCRIIKKSNQSEKGEEDVEVPDSSKSSS